MMSNGILDVFGEGYGCKRMGYVLVQYCAGCNANIVLTAAFLLSRSLERHSTGSGKTKVGNLANDRERVGADIGVLK